MDANRLADVFKAVGESGVANVNLVSPSQFSDVIARALEKVKPTLSVPVVYNTNSYEKVESLQKLDGLVDVYLPDLKFYDPSLSQKFCGASDYFDVASKAICEMLRQQPTNVFDDDGYVQKGVILRHLVLPGHVEDSKKVLDFVATVSKNVTMSLMSQYFPTHHDDVFKELNRRLYKHEYQSVCDYFFNLGLTNGYTQDVSSATVDYVPDFDVNILQNWLKNVPKTF